MNDRGIHVMRIKIDELKNQDKVLQQIKNYLDLIH